MSLSTPTTQETADSIVAELEASLSKTFPLLPKAVVRVIAKAFAGVVVLLYKYAGFMFLQRFAAYATMRETEVNGTLLSPLVEIGRQEGVGDPTYGQRAELTIEITVLQQGGTLDAFALLVYPPTQVIYQTIAPVVLNAATKQTTVIAASDPDGNAGVGAIGNRDPDDVLEFASAPDAVLQSVVVISLDVTGADPETEDAYRARVLAFLAARPQGGAPADYRTWGTGVAGVANIYPYAGAPGTVDIYVEATEEVDPDGIPPQSLLDSVLDAVTLDDGGLASRRPVCAATTVIPITRKEFAVVISGFLSYGQIGIEALLTEGIDQYLRSRAPYIHGLTRLPRADRITQGAIAGVAHEIVSSAGAQITSVALLLNGETITAYTLGEGEKAKLADDGVSYV